MLVESVTMDDLVVTSTCLRAEAAAVAGPLLSTAVRQHRTSKQFKLEWPLQRMRLDSSWPIPIHAPLLLWAAQ